MKILILSSNAKAGNGDISFQMLQEFKTLGHQVNILTNFCREKSDDIISYHGGKDSSLNILLNRVKIISAGIYKRPRVNNRYYFQDIYETITFYSSNSILKKTGFIPDVIFLLFNQHFINAKNLYQLNKLTGAPVFIFLMDMAPMTGGCHYAWDCEGYLNTCGFCPGLQEPGNSDISRRNYHFRKKYFEKTDMHFIAASEWQYRQLLQSALTSDKKIHKLLLGFNTDLYRHSSNKEALKLSLGLPPDKKILFFAAAGISEERKGLKHLLEAIELLKLEGHNDKIHLLIAGKVDESMTKSLPSNHTCAGFLNTSQLIEAYQASDFFVCPSIEDSGPSMINQALLCGLPVVSFDMGVAPDLVITGQTGYRARLGESADLANGISTLIAMDQAANEKMSMACRALAMEKCSLDKQTASLINLIRIAHRN
jgi:glycosyltransferase involved in cell wall biosynthesis